MDYLASLRQRSPTASIDRNYLYLTLVYLVATIGYLVTELVITDGNFGVPLDDTYIHYRFAENLSKGYIFQYNINEPVPATTSPLWVILLSVGFLLSLDPIPFSVFLSSLFLLLSGFLAYGLCNQLHFPRNISLVASLVTLLTGRMLWSSLSGMEITLCCFLVLLGVRFHLHELSSHEPSTRLRRLARLPGIPGVVFGLAALARPEALLLAMLYFLLTLWMVWRTDLARHRTGFALCCPAPLHESPNRSEACPQRTEGRHASDRPRPPSKGRLLVSSILFIAIVMPYSLFSYIHTGSFLPTTFRGQGGSLRVLPDLAFLGETALLFLLDNCLVFLVWICAAVYFVYGVIARRTVQLNLLLINMWTILLPAISSVLVPNPRHHGRYLIPLIPFIVILSVHAIQRIYDSLKDGGLATLPSIRNAFVAVLALTLPGTVVYANALGWNVDNINEQQVKIAHWLERNLPDERVFALNDIGAIAFITKKRVVDMAGLVTPATLDFQKMGIEDGSKSYLRLLKENGVNFLIIYPHWYEGLMRTYGYAFEKVHSARLEKNTICGGIEMFVFRIRWDSIAL